MLPPSFSCALLALGAVFTGAGAMSPYTTQQVNVAKARSNGAPLPPSQDPWYKAPAGYERAKPGQVLKVRDAPGLANATNAAQAYNILYRTTDSNYKPAWAVTTVYAPKNVSTVALVSYQVAYDSANVDASPSYTFYGGNVDTGFAAVLAAGWWVTVPDYEGPLASFTAGVQSGHATLDAVRATLNHESKLHSNGSCKYAMYGYSGGALASEWAAELQAQYAPEMRFAGAALGGLTPNVTSVTLSSNKGFGAFLIVNGVLGLTSQDKPSHDFIISQLKPKGPYNATTFLAARNQTMIQSVGTYLNQDIFQYFKDGEGVLNNKALLAVISRDGQMGYHGVPQMPVYAFKAVKDEISRIEDTDALINRFCGVGVNVVYDRNTIGGHATESINGELDALRFLKSVLTGKYSHTGCTISTRVQGNDTNPL